MLPAHAASDPVEITNAWQQTTKASMNSVEINGARTRAYVLTCPDCGSGARLFTIDLTTNAIIAEWEMRDGGDLFLDEEAGLLYVVEGASRVIALDTETGAQRWTVALPGPTAVAYDKDRSQIYVTSNGAQELVRVDLRLGRVVDSVDLRSVTGGPSARLTAVAVHPATGQVFADVSVGRSSIAAFDPATLDLVATYGSRGPLKDLAWDPSSSRFLGVGDNGLLALAPERGRAQLLTTTGGDSIEVDPHSRRAYVGTRDGLEIRDAQLGSLIYKFGPTALHEVSDIEILEEGVVLAASPEKLTRVVDRADMWLDNAPAQDIAAGDPFAWTVPVRGTAVEVVHSGGALPDGLTLDRTTGVLSGTPTTPGTYTFTIGATGSTLISYNTYTISVF